MTLVMSYGNDLIIVALSQEVIDGILKGLQEKWEVRERYQYLTFSESKLAATDQTEVFFILQTATISFLYDKFPSNDHQKSTPLPHADLQSITDNQLSFIHPQSTEKRTYWSYSVVSRNDKAQYHFFSIISSLICSNTERIHWQMILKWYHIWCK